MHRLFFAVLLLSQAHAAPPVPVNTYLTTSRNVYSSTNVTTAAWVQLVSSLGAEVTEIEVFDSCGETLKLGFGPSGLETDGPRIMPGGNGRVGIKIRQGTRVSIRAVSANCTAGESTINYYYY